MRTLDIIGAPRDLVLVVNADAASALRIFVPDSPPPESLLAIGTLSVVTWLDGWPSVTALGRTGPHGQWPD